MTTAPSSRSPQTQEVLRAAIEYFLSDLHTALPGRVESYDAETQKADVKPLIQRRIVASDGTELLEELPVLPQVPIMFPRTASFFLTFPINQGDLVLLVFNERSIDNYIAGEGGDTDPDEFRMHDLSDAVAFPGFYPDSKAIADIDTTAMSLGADNGGAKIAVSEDAVEVTYDNGLTLRVTGKDSDASLAVGDGARHAAIAEALQSLWGQLQTYLDAHVHTSAAPGSPTTPPVAPSPAYDTAINSSKLSFPDG